MKIQESQITMSAFHKEVRTIQREFAAELDDQAHLRIKEQQNKHADERADYTVQLRYMMLQQLLRTLCGRDAQVPRLHMNEVTPAKTARFALSEHYVEQERLDVAMQGKIKTDTMCIDIDISLSMSRSFAATHRIDTSARFYDPLVINLNGELPALDTRSFRFDIDNDGSEDQLSCLKEGNAFLALDSNENGCIDNGRELFGTVTGDGFKELRRHDSDRNGWIDENDPIMHKLRIWQNHGSESELVALGEVGIGAIYLGSADGTFTYKNAEQEALGRLRSTGMFLYENGQSGTVAQIDFARRSSSSGDDVLSQALATL